MLQLSGSDTEAERKNSIFGMERMSLPQGGETLVRGDKVDFMKSQGYGRQVRNPRMVVPALPWQRTGSSERSTRLQGENVGPIPRWRRLVHENGALRLERTA